MFTACVLGRYVAATVLTVPVPAVYAIGFEKLSVNVLLWYSSKFVTDNCSYIRRFFHNRSRCLSPFLTGRMFVRRTYFGQFDEL